MEESDAQFVSMELSRRDTRNRIAVVCIAVPVLVLSVLWLMRAPNSTQECHDHTAQLPVVCFNSVVAGCFTIVLVITLLDPIPLVAQYKVMGRPEIPEVQYSFCHIGRWSTFTLWCNTVGAFYFVMASLVGMMERDGSYSASLPTFRLCLGILWEITLPMAFMVNLVVTFVLIPGIKKQNAYHKLWYILRWRPQALHNGFVLAVAVEAAVALPCMAWEHFCIMLLYGLAYFVFAHLLFMRTGIYHYFFMDPRFKFAPMALIGLFVLLVTLYFAGYKLVQEASHSLLWKVIIVVAAACTCTFRDREAVNPFDGDMQGG